MDFRKFGSIILFLGIIIIGYGGFQISSNQPKVFDPSESKQTFLGRDDLGNMMNVERENKIRESKREDATKIIIAGGFIAFIGFGIFFSAKKSLSNTSDGQTFKTQFYSQAILNSGRWLIKNKENLIYLFLGAAVLLVVYFLFLRNDPESDGKKAAAVYCDCDEKYNDSIIRINNDFINSFSSYNFKYRQDARNKLKELYDPSVEAKNECYNYSTQHYNDLRNKYITNEEELRKFDFAYNAQRDIQEPTNLSKLSSTYSEIESKISIIKDPEPDIDKIKTDLIGRRIQGWNFTSIDEFVNATILDTVKSYNRIEYQIDLHLREKTGNKELDCEVIAAYLQNDNGWNIDNVNYLQPQEYFDKPGTYPLNLDEGQTSRWIKVGPSRRYNFTSDARFTIFYQDGSSLNSWDAAKWADKDIFKVKNLSKKSVSLIIKN